MLDSGRWFFPLAVCYSKVMCSCLVGGSCGLGPFCFVASTHSGASSMLEDPGQVLVCSRGALGWVAGALGEPLTSCVARTCQLGQGLCRCHPWGVLGPCAGCTSSCPGATTPSGQFLCFPVSWPAGVAGVLSRGPCWVLLVGPSSGGGVWMCGSMRFGILGAGFPGGSLLFENDVFVPCRWILWPWPFMLCGKYTIWGLLLARGPLPGSCVLSVCPGTGGWRLRRALDFLCGDGSHARAMFFPTQPLESSWATWWVHVFFPTCAFVEHRMLFDFGGRCFR